MIGLNTLWRSQQRWVPQTFLLPVWQKQQIKSNQLWKEGGVLRIYPGRTGSPKKIYIQGSFKFQKKNHFSKNGSLITVMLHTKTCSSRLHWCVNPFNASHATVLNAKECSGMVRISHPGRIFSALCVQAHMKSRQRRQWNGSKMHSNGTTYPVALSPAGACLTMKCFKVNRKGICGVATS
jgi:hypothetical protein